jgi:undecaprenyl-diphosphatase
MWNYLDLAAMTGLTPYIGVPALDPIVRFISNSNLFKGLPIMGLIWFFWFRDANGQAGNRRLIIATLIGSLVSLLIARAVNNIAPHRFRPLVEPALDYQRYINLGVPEWVVSESSFPSDHATLFFALATGLFLISRKTGLLVYLYVLLVIALPRVYLGLHYPTDIAAGAILGIGGVAFTTRRRVSKLYDARCASLLNKYPAAFQVALFLISMEIALLFDDVRELVHGVFKYFSM